MERNTKHGRSQGLYLGYIQKDKGEKVSRETEHNCPICNSERFCKPCMVTDHPTWECKDCGIEFYDSHTMYSDEIISGLKDEKMRPVIKHLLNIQTYEEKYGK